MIFAVILPFGIQYFEGPNRETVFSAAQVLFQGINQVCPVERLPFEMGFTPLTKDVGIGHPANDAALDECMRLNAQHKPYARYQKQEEGQGASNE